MSPNYDEQARCPGVLSSLGVSHIIRKFNSSEAKQLSAITPYIVNKHGAERWYKIPSGFSC